MSISYEYNPQIIFCHYSRNMNLVIFLAEVIDTRCLVYALPPTVLLPIPFKLYNRCLSHGLKMCILFGFNHKVIFCHLDKITSGRSD